VPSRGSAQTSSPSSAIRVSRPSCAGQASASSRSTRSCCRGREPFSIVANLPFPITTALLARLLGDPLVPLHRADLIVQLGFALKRTAAWPSTLQGILWSVGYELSIARRIDRSAFAAPPSVDAAVLRVVRRPAPLVPARDFPAFAAFVRNSFRQGSRPPIDRRLVLEHGLARRAGARDLAPEQWASLFRAVHPNR